MTRYVLGFMVTGSLMPGQDRVVLIRKARPKWQAGKLNGVGGHIEDGESPLDAMVREFEEEVGIKTPKEEWWRFCIMGGEDWEVHCFWTFRADIAGIQQMTDEPIEVHFIHDLQELVESHRAIENLPWLLAMTRSKLQDRHDYYQVIYHG